MVTPRTKQTQLHKFSTLSQRPRTQSASTCIFLESLLCLSSGTCWWYHQLCFQFYHSVHLICHWMEKHFCFYPTPHPILIWAQDRIFHLYKALEKEATLRPLNTKGVYSSFWSFSHNKIVFKRKQKAPMVLNQHNYSKTQHVVPVIKCQRTQIQKLSFMKTYTTLMHSTALSGSS